MSEPTPQPPNAPAPPPIEVAAEPSAPPAPPATRQSFFDTASIRPTVIIAIIIATLFFGTQILNEALPAAASEVPITAGGAVEIGEGVAITPLPGWIASAHEGGNGIRLEKGVVVIDLYTQTSASSARGLADSYRDEVLEADTTQFTATPIETFGSPSGTSGARFRYQGLFTGIDVAIEGEVTVLFESGLGVVADGWSRLGDLDDALAEIHAMIESIGAAQ